MEELRLQTSCGKCRTVTFKNCSDPVVNEGDVVYLRVSGAKQVPVSLVWRRGECSELARAFVAASREVCSERGVAVPKILR